MSVLRWRCDCGMVNNTITFDDGKYVHCNCTFCNKEQVVENTRTKAHNVFHGARKIA